MDEFRAYDGLVDYGYKRHYRVKHSRNEFARGYTIISMELKTFGERAKCVQVASNHEGAKVDA